MPALSLFRLCVSHCKNSPSRSRPTTLPRVSRENDQYLQDVQKIAQLLHSGAPQEELERAVVNGVNRRFYGEDVPEDVVDVRTRGVRACIRNAVYC